MNDTKFPFISALEKTIQKYIEDNNLVEVVRCKDCKYHRNGNKGIPYCSKIDYGYGWNDNDYCSMGERREDA